MKNKKYVIIFILLELLFSGMGMGVPFFLILFGFFLGLFIAKRNINKKDFLKIIFKYSLLSSTFTFILMLGIWGFFLFKILNKTYTIPNSGIPMILYEPFASFVGWMILMILISPFLQLLMTIYGAYIQLMISKKN